MPLSDMQRSGTLNKSEMNQKLDWNLPLSNMQRGNAMGLWKLQYPHLAPNLGDPQKLMGMADMYGNMAMRARVKADEAGFRDYSTRALQAKQALRELYGVD